MKTQIASLILLISTAFIAKAQGYNNYDLNIGEFSELRVLDGINVDYTCATDSAGRVFFDCQPDLASAFIFSNKGGKLTIQKKKKKIGTRNLPRLKVCSKFLTKVENTGDSTLRVLSIKEMPKFEAKLEGNGNLIVRHVEANEVKGIMRLGNGTLIISGRCDNAKLNLTGTGVIQADELVAGDASVSAKGTGSIGVNAVNNLGVFGMGSTSIYYKGTPAIKNRSVGLKLMPMK